MSSSDGTRVEQITVKEEITVRPAVRLLRKGDSVDQPGLELSRTARQTTAEQVGSALFEAILAGTIEPGSPLRLQDLADKLGTSMMPVREAVRRLEALGLVEIIPHRGAWVRPMTRADLLDTYFTRKHLETLAIRQAAARFTEQDAELARQALEDQNRAREFGDLVRARQAHERFHFVLYEASRSHWLIRSILPAFRNSERYRVESMRHVENPGRRTVEHQKILAALEQHDADGAADHLVQHLQTSIDLVYNSLPPDDEQPATAELSASG